MSNSELCPSRVSADLAESASLLRSNRHTQGSRCASCSPRVHLIKRLRISVVIQSILNAVALSLLAYFALGHLEPQDCATPPCKPCHSISTSPEQVTPMLTMDDDDSNYRPALDPSLGGSKYLHYTPISAAHSIQYVDHVFELGTWANATRYQGWPNDENEKLWSDLYLNNRAATTEVSQEEYSTLMNSSNRVPIPGHTDNFFVGLSIFHILHCLDDVRKAFYPRRYPEMSMVKSDGTLSFKTWAHVGMYKTPAPSTDHAMEIETSPKRPRDCELTVCLDHCIDSVRQQLMCQADTSAFTFDWRAEKLLEPMVDTIHVCKNFTKIQEWAEDHFVNLTNAMKKLHVEDGTIVDYTGTMNPEEVLVENENAYAPKWWLDLRVEDYFDDHALSVFSKQSSCE